MTTLRDPLATALREAIAAEPISISRDDALIARAIAGATAKLAVPAVTATAPEMEPAIEPASVNAKSAPVVKLASHRRSRVVRIALPVAAAFAASIALAAAFVSSQQGVVTPASRPVEAPAAPLAPAAAHTQNLPAEIATEPSVSVHDLPSAQPLVAVTTETVSSPPPPSVNSAVTAAELFRDANAERRAGNIGKAADLYRALQKQHPNAAETQASRVSLGRLLLDRQGDANGALVQFDAYLKSATEDSGTLSEEARVGRALALERLGRQAEERRAWEELVARHPQSLHAGRARERLEILSGSQ
jgi:TolA-binding protein